MKSSLWAALLALALVPTKWIFEDCKVGELPEGWSAARTGEGPGSVWKVIEDASAPAGPRVLAQTSSEAPARSFNLCILDETIIKDVDLTVSLKPVSGKTDQGGGLVWRLKDADNYYIARVNPLEENFRVYKVEGGTRTQLGSAKVEAAAGSWHTLRIVHEGDRIRASLNDTLHVDVKDAAFGAAGKVGLWTKADAVTSFDALSIKAPE
jgi:hypothetical protein